MPLASCLEYAEQILTTQKSSRGIAPPRKTRLAHLEIAVSGVSFGKQMISPVSRLWGSGTGRKSGHD